MCVSAKIVYMVKQALGGSTPSFPAPKYAAVNISGSIFGFSDRPVFDASSGLWRGPGMRLLGQMPGLSSAQAESMLFSVQEDPAQLGYVFVRCPLEFAVWKATWLEELRTEFLLAIWNDEAFEEYCRQQWRIHEEVSAQPKKAQEDWAEPLHASERGKVAKPFSFTTTR